MGMSGKAPGATYIKGNKMRTDTVLGDKTQSDHLDVDAQKLYMFDSKEERSGRVGHGYIRVGDIQERRPFEYQSVSQGERPDQSRSEVSQRPVTTWRCP